LYFVMKEVPDPSDSPSSLHLITHYRSLDDGRGTCFALDASARAVADTDPDRWLGDEIVHPGDAERVRHELARSEASGTSYHLLYRVVGPDGTVRVVSDRGVRIDEHGSPWLEGAVLDVTEEVNSAPVVGTGDLRWRDLGRAYPEALAIIVGNRIVFANAAAADLVGADTPEQLIGRKPTSFIQPEARPHFEKRIAELDTVPPLPYDEVCLLRFDGSPVWVRLQPVRIIYDGREAIHTILIDVTEERKNRYSLARRNRLITAGAVIGSQLLRVMEVDVVIDEVLDTMRQAAGAAWVAFHRRNDDDTVASVSRHEPDAPGSNIPAEVALRLVADGEPIYGKPEEILPPNRIADDLTLLAVIPVPLGRDDTGSIVLQFAEKIPGWSDEDMNALTIIGCSLGHAIERERIEANRRRSERKYRRLIEQASDGILVNDPQGTFVEVNDAASLMTGYRRSELRAMSPVDLISERSLAERPLNWHTLRPGDVRRFERELVRKDGTSFTAELSVTKNDDGLIQAILRDVSERTAAAAALRENRDRLSLALESGQMGIWDLDLETGRVRWTESTAAVFGIRLSDFDNRLSTVVSFVHPDDRDRFRDTMAHAVETGEDYFIECRIRRLDGSLAWIRARGKVVEDAAMPRRLVGVIHDVTDELRIRRAIRRKTSQLRAMMVALPDLIIRVRKGADGTLLLSAPRSQRGGATRSARRCHVSLPEAVREAYAHAYNELTSSRKAVAFTYELTDPSGQEVVFDVRMARSGEEEAVAVVRDVTQEHISELELIHARDEAQEMSRLKSAFLANMSHEIRTPLTSIIGFSDILGEQLSDEAGDFMSIIRSSGERLMQTLNSVLDLAQIESGTVNLDLRSADLLDRLRTAADFYAPQADSKGLELRLDVDPETELPACIDAAATDRVLSHLLSNALKFTHHGGITITAWREGGHACVGITDTGIGMSAEFQRRMFEPFFQESSGLARDYEGIGLGLPISWHLMSLMHGTIDVESRPNVGSSFILRFPEATCAEAPALNSTTSRLPRSDEQTRDRVLIVDDDDVTRLLVKQVLIDEFDIITAASGEEAIRSVTKHEPDAVLLDIMLGGGLNGEDVVWSLRKRGFSELPIIAVTARTQTGERQRLLSSGFDGYVSKPFRKEHLIATLRLIHHAAQNVTPRQYDLDSLLDLCKKRGLIDGAEVLDEEVILRQDIAHLRLPHDRARVALQVMLDRREE
jgi:PAS domain S-box-containing protein